MLNKETSCQILMRDLWHFNFLPSPTLQLGKGLRPCSMCDVPKAQVPGVNCLRRGNTDLVERSLIECFDLRGDSPRVGLRCLPCFTCRRTFSGLELDCQKRLRQLLWLQQLGTKDNKQGKQVTDLRVQERRGWERGIQR